MNTSAPKTTSGRFKDVTTGRCVRTPRGACFICVFAFLVISFLVGFGWIVVSEQRSIDRATRALEEATRQMTLSQTANVGQTVVYFNTNKTAEDLFYQHPMEDVFAQHARSAEQGEDLTASEETAIPSNQAAFLSTVESGVSGCPEKEERLTLTFYVFFKKSDVHIVQDDRDSNTLFSPVSFFGLDPLHTNASAGAKMHPGNERRDDVGLYLTHQNHASARAYGKVMLTGVCFYTGYDSVTKTRTDPLAFANALSEGKNNVFFHMRFSIKNAIGSRGLRFVKVISSKESFILQR